MCYDNLIRLFGNLFWGMQFRTCRKFWESTDFSLVLSQNFLQIQKPHRHYFDCDSLHESATNQMQICNIPSLRGRIADSHEAIQNKNQIARSVNPLKSFCYFWLSPKVESHLPLNLNLPITQSKQIVSDSRISKMDSSRCRAQNDESFINYHESLHNSHNHNA